jgi:Drexlerviridae HNH endonuclease
MGHFMLSKPEVLKEVLYYKDGKLLWNIQTNSRSKVGTEAGMLDKDGYRKIFFKKKNYRRSRLVWIYHHGSILDGLQIDHINKIRDDDHIENLRLVTARDNSRHKTNHSKYGHGVKLMPNGKFQGRVFSDGAYVHLGTYNTVEEAREAVRVWKG